MWSSKMVDGDPTPGAPPSPSPDEDALVRGLLAGLAGFRWLAWAWLAAVLVLTRGELDRPLVAIALATAAAAVSVAVHGRPARAAAAAADLAHGRRRGRGRRRAVGR
jgi:hypothetical protein